MTNKTQYKGEMVKPVSVEVSNRDQELIIEWGDLHTSVFPLYGLRKNCPCVMCRGGHDQMGRFEMGLFFVEPQQRFEIRKAESVGNHALKITWSDGHSSGMYRWDLLRAMCPETYRESQQ